MRLHHGHGSHHPGADHRQLEFLDVLLILTGMLLTWLIQPRLPY